MAVGSLALAFVAGVLSILSPCVLPILPIALGAAASEHRGGPVALAAGLAVSFVVIGLFAATIGYSIGLNAEIFRYVAAVLMIAVGAVLLVPRFQARLVLAGAPLANWGDRHFRATGRSSWPNGSGTAVGRCLDSLCRPDARRGVDPRRARARSRRGGRHNAILRVRRSAAARGPWLPVTRGTVALAHSTCCRRRAGQSGIRDSVNLHRRSGGHRP